MRNGKPGLRLARVSAPGSEPGRKFARSSSIPWACLQISIGVLTVQVGGVKRGRLRVVSHEGFARRYGVGAPPAGKGWKEPLKESWRAKDAPILFNRVSFWSFNASRSRLRISVRIS